MGPEFEDDIRRTKRTADGNEYLSVGNDSEDSMEVAGHEETIYLGSTAVSINCSKEVPEVTFDGQTLILDHPGEYILGRSQDCDLVINVPTVSARHAKLTLSDRGSVYVYNLGSTNGTWREK